MFRCAAPFPAFNRICCYKYFAALPLPFRNEGYGRNKTGIINFKYPKLKKVHRTGYICSLDNLIHTKGASHRNIGTCYLHYFGALHLSRLSIGFLLQIFCGPAANPPGMKGMAETKLELLILNLLN